MTVVRNWRRSPNSPTLPGSSARGAQRQAGQDSGSGRRAWGLAVSVAALALWLSPLAAFSADRIDTEGVDAKPRAAADQPSSLDELVEWIQAHGTEPLGITVGANGLPIWADYASGSLRTTAPASAPIEVPVETEGRPVAVGYSEPSGTLWTTDGEFPRRVMLHSVDDVIELAAGEGVNRPISVVAMPGRNQIVWGEHTSGRIMLADADGANAHPIVEDRQMTPFGLVWDESNDRLLWSDFVRGTVREMRFIDGQQRVLWTRDDGLSAPAGIALDTSRQKLYIADPGAETIFVADLSVGRSVLKPFEHKSPDDEALLSPWGVAVDSKRGLLFWTDSVRGKVWRTTLDSGATILLASAPPWPLPVVGANESDVTCLATVGGAVQKYLQTSAGRVRRCLRAVSLAKAVKWQIADTEIAAAVCISSLERLAGAPEARLPARVTLEQRLLGGCENSLASSLSHAGEVQPWVAFSGCALLPDPAEVASCASDVVVEAAALWIAKEHLRAREWLEEVRPYLARSAGQNSQEAARALNVLDHWDAAIRSLESAGGDDEDGLPIRSVGVSATGQTTTYFASRVRSQSKLRPVPDDGALRAGIPMRFSDNGDGTVTDETTGLMWEKKCDGCGSLHDYSFGYRWSADGDGMSIWDWLDAVNAEGATGFAEYDDWRIPNAKELFSILDFERFNPAVSTAFDGADCGLGCEDVAKASCSCTGMSHYWTSTTFADFPAHAVTVGFHLPLVGDRVKTNRMYVRAVRGPGQGSR